MPMKPIAIPLLALAALGTGAALPFRTAGADNTPDASARYMQLADSAEIMMKAERWDVAERMLTEALRDNPTNPLNPMLFSNLGLCQSNTGQYAKALQSFDIALIKSPCSPKVLANRARTCLLIGDEEGAAADLDKILESDSLNTDALRLRTMLLMRSGEFSKAEGYLQRMRRHGATDAWTLSELGRCIQKRGAVGEALKLYSEALKEAPESETYVAIAMYEIEGGAAGEAEETIRQGLKAYPREGMLYLLRAICHKEKFQNEDAEIDKKMAREYGVDDQTIGQFFSEEGAGKSKKR